jgi:NAD(P)H dehydrogenase (quinone)
MTKKILVIGAAGFVGAAVAQQLLADGFAVRGLARDLDKARKKLGSQVEWIGGDFNDLNLLEKALAGVDGVNISAPWRSELKLVGDVTAILARQGRKQVRVSYISGTTAMPDNRGYAMIDQKLKAEEVLAKSGVAYTVLRPSWFMDALSLFVRDGRATLFGNQKQAYYFISLADFSRAVSKAHQGDAALNQTLILNGPKALRIDDALQQYCAALYPGVKMGGMPIWFGKLLAGMMKNPGLRDFVEMMAYFEKSPVVSQPNGADRVLVQSSMTMEDWIKVQKKG